MQNTEACGILIRSAVAADADAIVGIYNHYVTRTIVAMEEEPVSAADMRRRINDVLSGPLPWLVAEQAGSLAGFAYAGKWRTRSGYRFAAEVTAYVAPGRSRRGIGSALYRDLLAGLRERSVHTVMGGIALPNEASVALHEKCGFRKVAHFEQVGFKFNQWIDVGYWQLGMPS